MLDPKLDLFVQVIERGINRGELVWDDPRALAELCFGGLSHLINWNHGLGRVLDRPVRAEPDLKLWATGIARAIGRN